MSEHVDYIKQYIDKLELINIIKRQILNNIDVVYIVEKIFEKMLREIVDEIYIELEAIVKRKAKETQVDEILKKIVIEAIEELAKTTPKKIEEI